MENVQDWHDPEQDVTRVRCRRESTVLVYNLRDPMPAELEKITRKLGVCCAAVRHTTDIVAIPSFLVIADPCGIEQELEDLFSWILELLCIDDCRFLLIGDAGAVTIPDQVQQMVLWSDESISTQSLEEFMVKEQQRCIWSLFARMGDDEKPLSVIRLGSGKARK